jgi:predicted NUDIX family phosphoesterase
MEKVLVTPRTVFESVGSFQGFNPDSEKYLNAILKEGNNFFMDRPAAEEDPTHKQLIPYIVVSRDNKFLVYTRGGKGTEKRLHAKKSIGIGGHINPVDQSDNASTGIVWAGYFAGLQRELHEELKIETSNIIGYTHAGIINDDGTPVSSVHLGCVHVVHLFQGAVASNEEAIQDVQFLSVEELVEMRDQLESWSQIYLDYTVEYRRQRREEEARAAA